MKRLILILGPNGVGKSTASAELLRLLPGSAYIDSDTLRMTHPAEFTEDSIALQKANILAVMRNYFASSFIENVIFPYGLHGHRQKLLEELLSELHHDFTVSLFPIILVCNEEENIRRMESDGRNKEQIKRAIEKTRAIYDNIAYPKINTTHLTPEQTAHELIRHMQERAALKHT